MKLDQSTPIVSLQFSFSNSKVVPTCLRELPTESQQRHNQRKTMATGVQVIDPTPNTSIALVINSIEAAGYELVDALHQKRIDPKDATGQNFYHMIRFVFMRKELVEENQDFVSRRAVLYAALAEISLNAFWRVRGFRNPYYRRGEVVPGAQALCLNFEARVPLWDAAGQPVLAWERDAAGHKIGTAPQPLRPQHRLVINQQQTFEIVPA